MTEVLHRVFRDHAGCLIRGTHPITAPSVPSNHLSCATFLTSRMEAPSYGLVQSYDGAGISGGLLHNIALLPRSLEQGSLWMLVRRIFDAAPGSLPCRALAIAMADVGWHLDAGGVVRHSDGTLVSGRDLREWIAPPAGVVPKEGPNWEQAKRVAILFHNLLADPASFRAQELYAIEWLCAGNRKNELEIYSRFAGHPVTSAASLRVDELPPAVHTAMCVYHSFSVNGPAPAAKALSAVKHVTDPVAFARSLIRKLGTTDFGNWHDEHGENSNRYDATRLAVQKHRDLFAMGKDLMPEDL